MESRRLFGFFSSAQVTAIIIAGIVTPGAVYAVATTAVAITDPANGHQAAVDSGRRLYVYDPVAGYANSPLNFVRISTFCGAAGSPLNYTPPAGDAFIVKSADFTFFHGIVGADNWSYLESSVGFVAGIDNPDVAGSKNSDLGNGYYLKNGEHLILSCTGNGSTFDISVEGYLVPSGAVPASAIADVTSPTTKNGKRL